MRNVSYVILAVVVLILVAGGAILASGRVLDVSRLNLAGVGQKSDDPDAINTAEVKTGTGSEVGFIHNQDYLGGDSGSYFIKSVEFESEGGTDKLSIKFDSNSSQGVPKYEITQIDRLLVIRFFDTRDYDFQLAKSTYVGDKVLVIDGVVIKGAGLSYPEDDSMIEVNIDLNTADFGYQVTEKALDLEIRVK